VSTRAKLVFRVAARAGTGENAGASLATGYTLPFIWTHVQTEIACDGTTQSAVAYSGIPSTVIYQNDQQVAADTQADDWGNFTKAGGRGRVLPGQGNLYVPCRTKLFNLAPATLSPGRSCSALADGAAPFFAARKPEPLPGGGRPPGDTR
jgi:hypothetical protein